MNDSSNCHSLQKSRTFDQLSKVSNLAQVVTYVHYLHLRKLAHIWNI